ncbi:MAG: hypothetical protein IJC18_01750, partial [Clostridia bacterium]|nr:hypothetical protein [Clostridia bacterium]
MVHDYSGYGFNMELGALPQHEMIELPSFNEPEEGAETDLILSVGKALVPPCPEVPKSLIGWLEAGYDDPTAQPKTIDSHEMPRPDSEETRIELFSDDSARRADFEYWIKEREMWASEALPAYKARKVYDRLYALYSELEREKDRLELMVGDGIFETTVEDGTVVRHPIV